MTALDKLIILILLICHSFLLEDSFGYATAQPSPVYSQVFGVCLVSFGYLLLFIMLYSQRKITETEPKTKILTVLLVASITVSLIYSVLTGRISSGAGTGLLELRVSVLLIILYVSLKKYFGKYSIKRFVTTFAKIGLLSATAFLLIYATKLDILATAIYQYGRITAFESGFLYVWTLFFCYALANVLLKINVKFNAISCIILGLSLLLSFRRTIVLIMLVSMVAIFITLPSATLRQHLKKIIRFFLIASIIFVAALVYNPELVDRVNPVGFFSTDSEAYGKSHASNIGHMLDLAIGIQLVKENPIFGIGFGTPIVGATDDAITSSLLHSQFLHFWLRMGILGLFLIIYFYYLMLSRAYFVIKNSIDKFDIAFSLTIFSFFLAQCLMSITAPPFYTNQKQQFLFILSFVVIEVIYQHTKRSKQTVHLPLSNAKINL